MASWETERADTTHRVGGTTGVVAKAKEASSQDAGLAGVSSHAPLRDRTNIYAAEPCDVSQSSDAVSDSEEDDRGEDLGRTRMPFAVPVGAPSHVVEQMLRNADVGRTQMEETTEQPSPSGRHAEQTRNDVGDEVCAELDDELYATQPPPKPSRRKRRRASSPWSQSKDDGDGKDVDLINLQNQPEALFEVDDGNGSVSEHSDASHDRTAGVRGFNFAELASDAYGKGRRRRGTGNDEGTTVAEVLARRRHALEIGSSDEEMSEESSEEDEEDTRADGAPVETTHPYRGASGNEPEAHREYVDLVGDGTDRDSVEVPDAPNSQRLRRMRQRRVDNFVTRSAVNENVTLDTPAADSVTLEQSITTKRPNAPWRFPIDLADFDSSVLCRARLESRLNAHTDSENTDSETTDCETSIRVAVQLFTAGSSALTHGVQREMSCTDLAAWLRAMNLCEENNPPGFFWQTLGIVLEDTRRGDLSVSASVSTSTSETASIIETSWELLFVAVRVWKAYRESEEIETENEIENEWSERAWSLVSEILNVSPLEKNDGGYSQCVVSRVTVLQRVWPRCTSPSGPAWELWRRCAQAGKAPGGKDSNENKNTLGRGEYPPAAAAAAVAAVAAVQGHAVMEHGHADVQPHCLPIQPRRDCCAMPAPGDDANAALVPSAHAQRSACPLALDLLCHHIGSSSDARVIRRDLGRALSASNFPKVDKIIEGFESINTVDKFKAFGGASVPCTKRAQAARHRAALHAKLLDVCLEHGMADQAASCLRQLRGALSITRCPLPSDDPTPLTMVCRAVGIASSSWLVRARTVGPEIFSKIKGWELLTKEGEATIDTLYALAKNSSISGDDESSILTPGTDDARRIGIVIAEAAAAAATTYAALVASGAQAVGAAATQTRFCKFLEAYVSAESMESWPSRVFTQRTLAALLVPGTYLSEQTCYADNPEVFVPALSLWAASAATDVVAGGIGPLAAALFANQALSRLNEGAASGTSTAAEAIERLQSVRSGEETAATRVLRGGETGAVDASGNYLASVFFGAAAAASMGRTKKEAAAVACMGGIPGDLLTEHEGEFRVSAGTMVGAQLGECGVAGANAIAKLATAFSTSVTQQSVLLQRALNVSTLNVSSSKYASHIAAHSIAVSGAQRWLADVSKRTVRAWPSDAWTFGNKNETAAQSTPVFASLAGLAGACGIPELPSHTKSSNAADAARCAMVGAMNRWDMSRRLTSARDDSQCDDASIVDPILADSALANAFAAATRDLAACTVGTLEWTLGVDGATTNEDGVLDALASALAESASEIGDARHETATSFVTRSLIPKFLATETHPTAPQRRCARVWLSVLRLYKRLVEKTDGFDLNRNTSDASSLRSTSVFAATLSTPGVMLLNAVCNENGGDMNHQAGVAVVEMFELLASRVDVAVGINVNVVATGRTGATATSYSAPVPVQRAPAPAPAASTGYFPFPGTASATAAAAQRAAAMERERAAAAAAEATKVRRELAAACLLELQSARTEQVSIAAVKKAALESVTSHAAVRLLRSSVAVAVCAICALSLDALSTAASSQTQNAFVSLSRKNNESDGDVLRTKEIAKHRALCSAALDRQRGAVATEHRDVTRFDFGGTDAGGRRSLPAGATMSSSFENTGPTPSVLSSESFESFWGCRAVPRGSHCVPNGWSALSPRERLVRVALGGSKLLKSVALLERGGELTSLVAPHVETLQSTAALLFESTSGNANASKELISVLEHLTETLRCKGVAVPRLPPKGMTATSGSQRGVDGGRGRGGRGRGGRFGSVRFGAR